MSSKAGREFKKPNIQKFLTSNKDVGLDKGSMVFERLELVPGLKLEYLSSATLSYMVSFSKDSFI